MTTQEKGYEVLCTDCFDRLFPDGFEEYTIGMLSASCYRCRKLIGKADFTGLSEDRATHAVHRANVLRAMEGR